MDAQDLIAWRKRMGLTQPEAAELMGVSRSGWQKREAGTYKITRETEFACRFIEDHPEIVAAEKTRAAGE